MCQPVVPERTSLLDRPAFWWPLLAVAVVTAIVTAAVAEGSVGYRLAMGFAGGLAVATLVFAVATQVAAERRLMSAATLLPDVREYYGVDVPAAVVAWLSLGGVGASESFSGELGDVRGTFTAVLGEGRTLVLHGPDGTRLLPATSNVA